MNTILNGRVHAILEFWFGPRFDGEKRDGEMRREWFMSSPEFDADIRARFADDYEKAWAGVYDAPTYSVVRAPHTHTASIMTLAAKSSIIQPFIIGTTNTK